MLILVCYLKMSCLADLRLLHHVAIRLKEWYIFTSMKNNGRMYRFVLRSCIEWSSSNDVCWKRHSNSLVVLELNISYELSRFARCVFDRKLWNWNLIAEVTPSPLHPPRTLTHIHTKDANTLSSATLFACASLYKYCWCGSAGFSNVSL